jgi:dihydrodipicolinate synthase/N-acetylneuraminate lyase
LAQLTKKVLDDGADGIYATGSSAETFLLSTEEQKKSIEVIVKAANGAEVIAHVGSVGTKNAIDLAKHAEKVGANGIASVVAAAPELIGGVTMMPVRSVATSLGCKVEWIGETQNIYIHY